MQNIVAALQIYTTQPFIVGDRVQLKSLGGATVVAGVVEQVRAPPMRKHVFWLPGAPHTPLMCACCAPLLLPADPTHAHAAAHRRQGPGARGQPGGWEQARPLSSACMPGAGGGAC